MSATAIVMMLLFMAAIWGGLLVSYIMLSRADKSGSAELRTQTTDPGSVVGHGQRSRRRPPRHRCGWD